jgi:hypothetical protein
MPGGGQVSVVEESRIGLVVMLLREGSFQDAVNVYQDESGEPYRIARRAVLELARAHSIPTRRSSIVSLLLLTLAGALGAVLSMGLGMTG